MFNKTVHLEILSALPKKKNQTNKHDEKHCNFFLLYCSKLSCTADIRFYLENFHSCFVGNHPFLVFTSLPDDVIWKVSMIGIMGGHQFIDNSSTTEQETTSVCKQLIDNSSTREQGTASVCQKIINSSTIEQETNVSLSIH
jgi:hypothetical protein